MFLRIWALTVFAGLTVCGQGQTLAHKNWQGSGLTVESWWSRGVFCSAGSDWKKVVGEMDALERMGCDAVEVKPAGFAAVDEMEAVTEAAGGRKMRVVVELSGGGEDEVVAAMGFWGARGAGGFSVAGGVSGRIRQAAGGRVVIADGSGGQLQVEKMPEGDAALRGWLPGAMRPGVLMEDGRERMGYTRAAMLLINGVAVRVSVNAVLPGAGGEQRARQFSADEMLLWVPQERMATDGMAEWVAKLSELHHGNAALRAGQAVALNFADAGVVGWAVPARDGRSAVIAVCNLGGRAVRVPVSSALRGAGVRGLSMKTLLRSDAAMAGGDSLEGIGLGVDGVFVGEVR